MEMPARTYNEKFESFLKILESDDRFDNVYLLCTLCQCGYGNSFRL